MLARLRQPRLALDPLIAEAKRRARKRRLFVVLAVGAVAGIGAWLALRPHAIPRAASPSVVPAVRPPGGVFTEGGLIVGIGGPPLAYPDSMADASAAPDGSAWMVGSLAWRWDGAGWRSVELPKFPRSEFTSVATISARNAWAVGWRSQTKSGRHEFALIEHWDGSRWSPVPQPHLGEAALSAVAASGSRDVWAAGSTFHYMDNFMGRKDSPLLLHWNGSAWREQALPWSQRGMAIEKVVPIAGQGLWVVVSQVPKHDFGSARGNVHVQLAYWNGRHWQFIPEPFGSRDPLSDFDATAWNDAWAVGSYEARSEPMYANNNPKHMQSRSVSAHWNGHAWRIVGVPGRPGYPDDELDQVVAVGPRDAWASGVSQNVLAKRPMSQPGLLLHWDGRDWAVTPGVVPDLGFQGGNLSVTASRDGSAWALGTCAEDNVILRWTNGAWSVVQHPPDQHWDFPPQDRPSTLPVCVVR